MKFRFPNMADPMATQLGKQLEVFDSKSKFPKTPTKSKKVRAKDTGIIYIGDGKKWVEVNTGPKA